MRVNVLRVSVFVLLLLASVTAQADMLKVRSKEYQGTFQGYESKKFIFRAKSGKMLKQLRSSVRSLKLDSPTEIRLQTKSKKKPEKVLLIGYNKGKFSIKRSGKASNVTGMNVERITVMRQAASGGTSTDTRNAISPIDVSGLENAQLTPQQSSAVEQYKRARSTYDSFLAQSSALVAKMNNASGSTRSSLLTQLRQRKDQEQPIKREMESAHAEMLSAFPGLANGGTIEIKSRPTQSSAPSKPVLQRTELTLVVPKLGANEVFVIDAAVLNQLGAANKNQESAIKIYDAAAKDYERFVADPAGVAKEKDPEQIRNNLSNAQKTLLMAFPNLELIEQ